MVRSGMPSTGCRPAGRSRRRSDRRGPNPEFAGIRPETSQKCPRTSLKTSRDVLETSPERAHAVTMVISSRIDHESNSDSALSLSRDQVMTACEVAESCRCRCPRCTTWPTGESCRRPALDAVGAFSARASRSFCGRSGPYEQDVLGRLHVVRRECVPAGRGGRDVGASGLVRVSLVAATALVVGVPDPGVDGGLGCERPWPVSAGGWHYGRFGNEDVPGLCGEARIRARTFVIAHGRAIDASWSARVCLGRPDRRSDGVVLSDLRLVCRACSCRAGMRGLRQGATVATAASIGTPSMPSRSLSSDALRGTIETALSRRKWQRAIRGSDGSQKGPGRRVAF